MLERCTVAEIEKTIYGAQWRESVAMDRLAWQTALLMAAAGSKPPTEEEIAMAALRPPHDGWTAEKLLGRPPLPIDPRDAGQVNVVAEAAPDDGRPDWDEATRREKAERAKLMLAMAAAARGKAD